MGAPTTCPGEEVGLWMTPISIGVPTAEIAEPALFVEDPDVVTAEVSTTISPLDAVWLIRIEEGVEVVTMTSLLEAVLLTRTGGGAEVATITSPLDAVPLTRMGEGVEVTALTPLPDAVLLTRTGNGVEVDTITSPLDAVLLTRIGDEFNVATII